MTTLEISEEKKKLAAALAEAIWNSPLYKDDKIDINISCIKLEPIYSDMGLRDRIVGVEVTTKIV